MASFVAQGLDPSGFSIHPALLDAAQHASIFHPATIYRLRGRAYETLGDFEHAHLDYETTLQRAREAEERQAEWQALMDLGALWAQRDYTQTGSYYQQALALSRHLGDPLTLAHSLNRLGNWHVNIEEPSEALMTAAFERLLEADLDRAKENVS